MTLVGLELVYIWLDDAVEVVFRVTFQITMFLCSLGEAVSDDSGLVRMIVNELLGSIPPLVQVFEPDL